MLVAAQAVSGVVFAGHTRTDEPISSQRRAFFVQFASEDLSHPTASAAELARLFAEKCATMLADIDRLSRCCDVAVVTVRLARMIFDLTQEVLTPHVLNHALKLRNLPPRCAYTPNEFSCSHHAVCRGSPILTGN